MKFTLNWLKEYLETNATLEQICDKLSALGLEVEDVIDRSEKYKNFIVAHVVEAEQHPNADRLRQCLVNTGKEQLQVVCGAPNVRKGLKVVFALPGAVVPSNGMVLKKTAIRGVESNGMICSDAELLLSEESNGIRELPDDAPVGTDFASYMGFTDPVIEINLTPNRVDAAGVYGIARDLAAAGLGTLKPLPLQPVPGGFVSPIAVHIKDQKACPLFIGRMIRNLKNGPSPKWLQDYLTAIGSRSISALVDITNLMCIGLNRPLHAFDADKLKGDITVRLATNGEKFTDLKGNERELNDHTIVVCDENGPQAMGGVIGGLHSGCTDDTVNVFLESAYFDPSFIRRTGREFGIDSDAKYRFERGIDPAFADEGIEIATRMILDLCGGEPSNLAIAGTEPAWQRTITFDPAAVKNLGGLSVPATEQIDILMTLGFDVRVRKDENLLDVTPPSWRNDVTVAADLVEEILRMKSYDAIPAVSVTSDTPTPKPALTPEQKRLNDLRRLCAMLGLSEAVTWSFLSDRAHAAFSYADKKTIRLANPISSDLGIMRHAQLPNLLDAAKRNSDRKLENTALFEIGSVFYGTLPNEQPVILSGLRSGNGPLSWQQKSAPVDFFAVKKDVFALLQLAGFNTDTLSVSAEAPHWYHPGQSGVVRLGKSILAQFGVIHPKILKDWDIDIPVAGFEIFVDNLPPIKAKKSATKAALILSSLQPVTRDFAFVVANTVPADSILKAARNVDKNLITDVTLFDVYAGKGVTEGHRSLAFTITLQPQNATLTDAEIDAVSKNVVSAVEKLGGQLRG